MFDSLERRYHIKALPRSSRPVSYYSDAEHSTQYGEAYSLWYRCQPAGACR